MLVERVNHREACSPLMEPSMNRLAAHIEQEVVHPANVPLQSESETAQVGWTGDAGPRGGFFRNRHDSGKPLITDFVKAFHEIDSVQVLAPAMDVRHPFPLFARIVEVKHGSDRIDAKPIDVILVQPEQAISDEEIAHLVSTIVETKR